MANQAPHRLMLIVRGVNVFPSQIEAEILKVDGLSETVGSY